MRRTTQQGAAPAARLTLVPPAVGEALRSPGRPLDPSIREALEPRFGHDFGNVRVHDDERAAESARAVGARAFTIGRDVVFGAREYAPGTVDGQRLLAHELTHVVQQGGAAVPPPSRIEVTAPGDAFETEADEIAERVLAGGDVRVSSGLHELARATFNVGAQQVQVNYSEVVLIPAADHESAIETRFVTWTGSADASAIHTDLTALTAAQKRWVLFALDLLVDNTTAAHAALDRVQAVRRLIAHAPGAVAQPLSGGPLSEFPTEALRVSGWFEVALPARLSAPTGSTRTTLGEIFNPPPGPSAPAGGALDVTRLESDLPLQLTILLMRLDPANRTAVRTQAMGDLQSIADPIQAEARSFFSPYADTAMRNIFSSNWVYSANLSSTQSLPITDARRISYLLNRAEYVGRQTRSSGGSIFSDVNYDSSNPAHRHELLRIVTDMAADPTVQPIVDRLIRDTGRTTHTGGVPHIYVSTEYESSSSTECQARWQTIDTMCHELVHAMVHSRFPARASSVRFGQIIREGFTEVLGIQLYRRVRTRAGSDPAFKAQMETGISGAPCPTPSTGSIGYGDAGPAAERIRRLVGDDNFRAAYFLNAVQLVGLTP